METLDKEQQFERLYATTPVYEWELIINPDHGRTKVTYGLFWGLIVAGMFTFMAVIMSLWYRYLVSADKRHYYAINQYGMCSTSEQIIPEIAYTIVRRSAWVGCAICVFSEIFIGPMAFVGAGGAALMSFTMTKFRSAPHKSQCLFDASSILKNYRANDYLRRTKHSLISLIIPESKLTPIIEVIKQYNDTFEEEFVDLYKDTKFQAQPIILEIVR